MKLKVLLLVFTLALTAGSAFGTEFHFTFTGNDLNATGTLTGDSLGGGIFQITSGHIDITGDITASRLPIPLLASTLRPLDSSTTTINCSRA
jgi:hypothetical protein